MQLITTQLIEEYQKKLKKVEAELRGFPESRGLAVKAGVLEMIISDLQSKQSEERQNIVDAFENGAVSEIRGTYNGSEDYFNQTFKQEQKVIDTNGGEEGK